MSVTPEDPARRRRRDTPPPKAGPGERDTLVGFLDYLRSSIAAKAQSVAEPDVRTPGVGSGTNLLGLINHLTQVERYLFLGEDVSDWKATFHAGADETVGDVVAAYQRATGEANQRIAACTELTDALPVPRGRKHAPSLRWALVHMIEETGRHAGQADILRELIDGTTGR